jgi:bud site selection protein 20
MGGPQRRRANTARNKQYRKARGQKRQTRAVD